MNFYLKTGGILLLALVSSSCAVQTIKYVTPVPPAIHVSAELQPIRIVVKNSIEYPAGYKKPQGFDANPEQRVLLILKDRLTVNQIVAVDGEGKSKFEIELKKFQAVREGGNWKATVGLTAISANSDGGFDKQNIETSITRYNAVGDGDAVKAVSSALSEALDAIHWKNFAGK